MVFERKALAELLDLMYELGQPFPETITLSPQERITHDVQETLKAQRERDSVSRRLYEPAVKKSDLLKTVTMPTGSTPRTPPPFEHINLRRVTNAIDPSIKKAMTMTIEDEFSYYRGGFNVALRIR